MIDPKVYSQLWIFKVQQQVFFLNLDFIESLFNEVILEKIKNFYEEEIYIKFTEKGARAISRFKELTILGKDFFSLEN